MFGNHKTHKDKVRKLPPLSNYLSKYEIHCCVSKPHSLFYETLLLDFFGLLIPFITTPLTRPQNDTIITSRAIRISNFLSKMKKCKRANQFDMIPNTRHQKSSINKKQIKNSSAVQNVNKNNAMTCKSFKTYIWWTPKQVWTEEVRIYLKYFVTVKLNTFQELWCGNKNCKKCVMQEKNTWCNIWQLSRLIWQNVSIVIL